MAEKVTYKQRIAPVKRTTLSDYFKVSSQYYEGYINMESFRSKMSTVFKQAWSDYQYIMQINDLHKSSNVMETFSHYEYLVPVMDTSIRSFICEHIDTMEWRQPIAMTDRTKELRRISNHYQKAAIKAPIMYYAGGKLSEKGSKLLAKRSSILAKNENKLVAKIGDYLESATKSKKSPLLNALSKGKKEINYSEWLIGEAVDGVANKIVDTNDKRMPETISAELKSHVFTDFLSNMEFDKKTISGFETVENHFWFVADKASDIVPYVGIAKMTLDFISNTALAGIYWNQLKNQEKVQKMQELTWKEFTSKLKTYLKKDIWSLNDNELEDLYKLLNN